MVVCVVALAFAVLGMMADRAAAEVRELKLYNTHTQERATIVFKRDGVYDPDGLRQLNQFLRDWRENRVTEMDPQLFDLVWDVYRQTGSDAAIAVVCGYRSPPTNEMLRRRSDGVAENSLHMRGQALDFFIPGVKLATLRAIGLRMQDGGVGFYPTSGSPFVHLDTGSVRHWPRMTHDQLVQVFPEGKTLHIPSDGKPLPGYNEALAAYNARKANASVVIASAEPRKPQSRPTFLTRLLGKDPDQAEDDATAAETAGPAKQTIGVAVASYETAPTPLPHLAPTHAAAPTPIVVASAPAPKPLPPVVPTGNPYAAASQTLTAALAARAPAPRAAPDFSGTWAAPAVPNALTAALAARQRKTPGASLPIAPTAVVATVAVGRPRVADITGAVIKDEASGADLPPVLAYATEPAVVAMPPRPVLASTGVLLPRPSPLGSGAAPAAPAPVAAAPAPRQVAPAAVPSPLMLTALDTQSLRLWMRDGSTRQRGYALMTLPDFTQSAALMSAPTVTYATGFSAAPNGMLRTDHFAPLPADPASGFAVR